MGFRRAVWSGFAHYTDFFGRASRPAYWWWALFAAIAWYLAQTLEVALALRPLDPSLPVVGSLGPVSALAYLALVMPTSAVTVRRLHDVDRSGWWALLGLIPIIGGLVLFYFFISAGSPVPNRSGPPPPGTGGIRYVLHERTPGADVDGSRAGFGGG